MSQGEATHLAVQAILLALKLSAPFLIAGLVVGVLVSAFQAATQIQEPTLTFIPKLVAMLVVLVVAGPWMLGEIVAYAHTLFASIPTQVHGS